MKYLWWKLTPPPVVRPLHYLKQVTGLEVFCYPGTDAEVQLLKGLPNLTFLNLISSKVTDVGLKDIGEMKSLKSLNLYQTSVTVAGMRELVGLKSLTTLKLPRNITDAAMPDIAKLTSLTTKAACLDSLRATGLKIWLFFVQIERFSDIIHIKDR